MKIEEGTAFSVITPATVTKIVDMKWGWASTLLETLNGKHRVFVYLNKHRLDYFKPVTIEKTFRVGLSDEQELELVRRLENWAEYDSDIDISNEYDATSIVFKNVPIRDELRYLSDMRTFGHYAETIYTLPTETKEVTEGHLSAYRHIKDAGHLPIRPYVEECIRKLSDSQIWHTVSKPENLDEPHTLTIQLHTLQIFFADSDNPTCSMQYFDKSEFDADLEELTKILE